MHIGTISDGYWVDSAVDFFFYKEAILKKRKSQYISLIFAENLRSLHFLNSIHISFHVIVWPVLLILLKLYLSLHVS